MRQNPAKLGDPITPRERQTLALLASGALNKEIADRLAISEHTAKFHVNRILRKLGARNRAHAVALWTRTAAPAGPAPDQVLGVSLF